MSAKRREPVLLHIQDAESWLSRAKTEYQAANDIRGELDLSLAQAEVKYAWELSRGGRKTATARSVAPRSMSRWMLPVAACLALGILAVVWPRLAGHQPEGSVAVRPQSAAVTAPQQAGPAKTPSPQNPSAAERPSAAPPVILEQPPLKTPEEPVVPPASSESAVVAPESPNRQVVPPADNARPASSNNGTALDLDELARMAQETLTSGESVSGGQH